MRDRLQVFTCILVLALGLAGCTAPTAGPPERDAGPTEAEEPIAPPEVDLMTYASNATRWDIRVTAVTEALDLASYRILLITPSGSIRVEPPDGTDGSRASWIASVTSGGQVAARPYQDGDPTPDGPSYRLTYVDHQEGGAVDVLDSLIITYHEDTGEPTAGSGDRMPSGPHELILVHLASDRPAGRLENRF